MGTKTALILQAWQQKPTNNWYPWLKTELEKKGYQVFLPDLPTMHTNLPNMQKQLEFLHNTIPIDKDLIVFGHSLGCLLGMRLAEKKQFQKLLLVAGWDFDDLTSEHKLFWPNKLDHYTITKNVSQIFCFSSDNDPYMTAFTVSQMSKRLNAQFILVKGAGHFTKEFGITKIPQLLSYL